MKIRTFVHNPFQERSYLLTDENTKECILIDAGCYTKRETENIQEYIKSNKLILKYLLNTHCHFDHIFGVLAMKNKYNVPFLAHQGENPILETGKENSERYNIPAENLVSEIDTFVEENEILSFGNTKLKAIFVPGHTPGHIVLYNEEEKVLFSGDVLFRNSIGRTDFPLGNHEQLISGIKEKVLTLPEETKVYAGHGPTTTIGYEKLMNPFLA